MKFNLSKNNDPVPDKKSNVWGALILVLAVVIGGLIYLIPKHETSTVLAAAPAPAPVLEPVAVPVSEPPRIAASFARGTAAPADISNEVVDQIKKGRKVTIYGYASSEGDLSVNEKLAAERAAAFKQYLISKGVDEAMIVAIGKGIDNPIATNETEPGRAQNRRVEVHIE